MGVMGYMAGVLRYCNNYRPIAIATITSKLLESIILLKCEEYRL